MTTDDQLGRFDPRSLETDVLQLWERENTYQKWKAKQKGKSTFLFIDGPPYPTGAIHVGTAWNKILKDVVLRYKVMQGFAIADTPGYDMHGLPVELKVEKELGIKNKKEIEDRGIEFFVESCRKFAKKNLNVMSGQFKRLGVWMDWEHPYMTIENYYVEGVWWALAQAAKRGLLYPGKKVLTVCPRCETALAKHEQEYTNLKENSVYVKFPVAGKPKEFILIWTTTPWTLPTNLAVMVHPDFEYVRAEVNGEVWILAKGLVNALLASLDKPYKIIETFKGERLKGLRYEHPLVEKLPALQSFAFQHKNVHTVVLSEDYVALDAGTGCVHCAPGTGPEDFEVGQQNQIPPFCPITMNGLFTDEAGKYAGLTVKKNADGVVLEDLRQKGLLLHEVEVEHEYPCCWRCKTPLIFLTTNQWFFATSTLRGKMLEENENVKWTPVWASRWFSSWLTSLQDWCISRQRYWGIPLPIWICEKCKKMEVIGSVTELEARGAHPKDLHRPWIDEVSWNCVCGGKFSRVPDILDVWLDSGAAVWASQGFPKNENVITDRFPASFILEGKDQIRGWFNSLMSLSMVALGQPPYKAVYMHGFVNDEAGRKFSKSQGNYVSPDEVTEIYGSEALRFFVIGATPPGEDMNFGPRYVKEAFNDLSVFWNLFAFAEPHLEEGKIDEAALRTEDRWILSRLHSTIKALTEELENYNLPQAPRLLKRFFVEDLSHTYVKLVRDRLRQGDKTVATVLCHVMNRLVRLAAPLTPLLAEAAYRKFFRKAESVHLLSWPAVEEEWIDAKLEEEMEKALHVVAATLAARTAANIKLRWPIKAVWVDQPVLEQYSEVITKLANAKELKLGKEPPKGWIRAEGTEVYIDPTEDDSLKGERATRELMRAVQALRKQQGLETADAIELFIQPALELIKPFEAEMAAKVGAKKLNFVETLPTLPATSSIKTDYGSFSIGFKKV